MSLESRERVYTGNRPLLFYVYVAHLWPRQLQPLLHLHLEDLPLLLLWRFQSPYGPTISPRVFLILLMIISAYIYLFIYFSLEYFFSRWLMGVCIICFFFLFGKRWLWERSDHVQEVYDCGVMFMNKVKDALSNEKGKYYELLVLMRDFCNKIWWLVFSFG